MWIHSLNKSFSVGLATYFGTGSANLLWVWMGCTAIKEVVKGFHCCLRACVDFGCWVIECMHGGVIN